MEDSPLLVFNHHATPINAGHKDIKGERPCGNFVILYHVHILEGWKMIIFGTSAS